MENTSEIILVHWNITDVLTSGSQIINHWEAICHIYYKFISHSQISVLSSKCSRAVIHIQPSRYLNHHLLLSSVFFLHVQRFDQAGSHSVKHRQESNPRLTHKHTDIFSSHAKAGVEIPSYPKNADPFCSTAPHLYIWDTHAYTHTRHTHFTCVRLNTWQNLSVIQ